MGVSSKDVISELGAFDEDFWVKLPFSSISFSLWFDEFSAI